MPVRLTILSALMLATIVTFAGLVLDEGGWFLPQSGDAHWLQVKRDFELRAQPVTPRTLIFARQFQLETTSGAVSAELAATGKVEVFLAGESVHQGAPPTDAFIYRDTLKLPPLAAGAHEIMIVVESSSLPPMILFSSPELNLRSDKSWSVWEPGGPPLALLTLDESRALPIADQTPAVAHWWGIANLPLLLVSAVLAVLLLRRYRAEGVDLEARCDRDMFGLRVICLLSWLVLLITSMLSLPSHTRGFDYTGHMEYVQYIVELGRLPLATDGWQMFQTPLFYLLGSVLYGIGIELGSPEHAAELVRLLVLLCGFAQIEIGYRLMKTVFPGELLAQATGLLVIVFTPMHLYMSQYVGNEPLAAALVSLATLILVRYFYEPEHLTRPRDQYLLGATLGAAILAKVSALLIGLPAIVCLLLASRQQQLSAREIGLAALRIVAVVALVAGWFFLRNYVELGSPLVNGWSLDRGQDWWQDPGYRQLSDLLSFGQALVNPVYAGVHGLWDSLYSTLWFDGFLGSIVVNTWRPPWNYLFAMPVVWLSLLPSALILIGAFWNERNQAAALRLTLTFARVAVYVYLFAIAWLYATLPIYSTAKATYAMGLLPCLGLLAAQGSRRLYRVPVLGELLAGGLMAWAVFSYLAYLPLPLFLR